MHNYFQFWHNNRKEDYSFKTLTMKKLILLSFFLFFIFCNLFSQAKLDYSSKWFLGINVGGTWQTTDVQNKSNAGYGYGLTLGKAFNYDYGKRLSFDLRGRYLRGFWYGQNTDSTSISPSYSGVLSQEANNYKDSIGFSVNNFQTDLHRLAIELVIHANGLKERTNWDPYIFGGIGVTRHQTYGNLTNNGQLYDYKGLPAINSSSVSSLLDATYDTPLDGSQKSKYRSSVMPSLGFGIGYQLTKGVSIGLEHKTTFTGLDDFDGFAAPSKYKQDIYHYTSGYIKFQLGGEKKPKNEIDQAQLPTPAPIEIVNQLPLVTFVNPSATNTVVNSPNYTIIADVKYNISGRENIQFKQNDVSSANFTYNTATERLESNIVLNEGQNLIYITAQNTIGSAWNSTIVIYKKERGSPPVVTITSPNTPQITVNNPSYVLTSKILNIQDGSQITLLVNDQNHTDFTYTPSTTIMSAPLTLKEGNNTIVIKGTNQFGVDSKNTTILYQKPIVVNPPVVTFITPNIDPITSQTSSYNVSATALNVVSASGIQVKLNGISVTNFTFNSSSSLVSFPANLIEGANSISITGTNTAGTDTEIQTINFQKPVTILPPVVTFITPNIDPITSQTSSYNVSATVLNVASATGIQVKLNGINLTNFAFNSSSSLVTFSANLIEGANSISITGTNTAGTDTEIQTINFQKPVTILPPVVTFINPATSGSIVSEDKLGLISVIQFVENSGQIELTQNGNIINPASYSFDVITKKVLFNTVLVEGNNSFTVKGTNFSGTDVETTSVFFRKPIPPCQAPVITILAPTMTETAINTCVFTAKLENITSLNQIQFVLNGSAIVDGNFDPSSKLFSKNVVLQKGVNIFNIAVLNDCGSAKDQKNISYSPVVLSPCISPSIVITSSSSANNTITKNTSFNLSALLTNIETNSQILIKQNDLAINFDFDPQTHMVQINQILKLGINKFVIEATNKCGKVIENHIVTLQNGQDVNINAPVITITEPAYFPITIEKTSTIVKGNITKVTDVNQVIITVNGQVITAYNPAFNSGGMTFQFALDATPQTSIFQLTFTAINSFGKAIKKGSITLKPSGTNTPPVANPPKGKGGH